MVSSHQQPMVIVRSRDALAHAASVCSANEDSRFTEVKIVIRYIRVGVNLA